MPAQFIIFDRLDEGTAKITSSANVIDEDHYAEQLDLQGITYVMVPLDSNSGYVVFENNRPSFAIRPKITAEWSKKQLEPMEETVLTENIPPCKIQIFGVLGGELQHPGGPVKLSFVLPGDYTVIFEAFPYRQVYADFNVAFKNPNAQGEA